MKQIRLNAFFQNCSGHQSIGQWRNPADTSTQYKNIKYWTNIAQELERGYFDGIFLADVMGVYDVFGGNADAALRSGTQVPCNDPTLIIPPMAMATEHLGFGVTCTLSFEPPFPFARRMSTLDHLTNGRVAWNVVTGYLESAAKASGLNKMTAHDLRYDIADEYMDVVYKLWEKSWDDDAVQLDKEKGIYTDPAKVQRIDHQGEHYKVDAVHLCEPSPQRTPLIFQAGASNRGQVFAAKHAECVFVNAPSKKIIAQTVKKFREALVEQGRKPDDALIFCLLTIIVGKTDEEAQQKFQEYQRYIDREGALTLMSGWTGIDFSGLSPDETIKHERTDAIHSAIDRFTTADPDKTWTVGEVADFVGVGGASPIVVGSAQAVADAMQSWMEETGVDGFNLAYVTVPDSITDFIDLVVPILQERGLYKQSYDDGTLRHKLFGAGDHSLTARSYATASLDTHKQKRLAAVD
ncbi:dibenzothiophene sulfone monooxygenase [Pusillimonas sp. T7-7]|uniref:LLM class flavin-dependent oxidoreductase n=1 Tax=Pusillimonas sp. (strain T7-7) TaxID=1007105 RepID=UPI000208467D|nr:LLM class flavin-dependent oxidoreductase [Pusillimonas sp. T7-7]AEC22130.1 dibenzothiophene sulfone monooxygenase [Pusillimonas sp. T7-7]